jgi:putative ubiquitin-RnfH superfamily antitoxin RatB of RatAB toxin-antitoxin module
MRVRIVYALPERHVETTLDLNDGASVADALARVAIDERFSKIGGAPECAVFGRIVQRTHALTDGDRIEILRPLLVDPKEIRRQAVAASRLKR